MPGFTGLIPQTYARKAIMLVGGLQIPAIPGARLSNLLNLQYAPLVGNYGRFNKTTGPQVPYVEIPVQPLDLAGGVFSSTFLNYLVTRSNDSAFDAAVIPGGVTYWNGYEGFVLRGAKFAGFNIRSSAQGGLQIMCRFMGSNSESGGTAPPTIPALQILGSAPSFTPWSRVPMLSFQNLGFQINGQVCVDIWEYSLDFQNSLTPNMGHNLSPFPVDVNAGDWVANCNISTQAGCVLPTDPPDPTSNLPDPTRTFDLSMTVFGSSAKSTVFDLPSCADNTPYELAHADGRQMRQKQLIAENYPTGQSCPLAITVSGF